MKIEQKEGKYFLIGKINHCEQDYLIDYLLHFGLELKVMRPEKLKKVYLNKLEKMLIKNKN